MTPHPTSLADAAAVQDGRGDFAVLLDEFLDVFYTELDRVARQRMIDDEPAPTGDQRRDAPVGAVGAGDPGLVGGAVAVRGRTVVRGADGGWIVEAVPGGKPAGVPAPADFHGGGTVAPGKDAAVGRRC